MILGEDYFCGMQYCQAMIRCLTGKVVEDIEVKTDYGNIKCLDFFVVDINTVKKHLGDRVPYVAAIKIELPYEGEYRVIGTDVLVELVEELSSDVASEFVETLQRQKLKHIEFVGQHEVIEICDKMLSPKETVELIARDKNLEAIHTFRDLRDTITKLKWNSLIFNKNNNDKEGENTDE